MKLQTHQGIPLDFSNINYVENNLDEILSRMNVYAEVHLSADFPSCKVVVNESGSYAVTAISVFAHSSRSRPPAFFVQ